MSLERANDQHTYGFWFGADNFVKVTGPNTTLFAPFNIIAYAQYIYDFTTNMVVKSRFGYSTNDNVIHPELCKVTDVLSMNELKEYFKQIFPNEN